MADKEVKPVVPAEDVTENTVPKNAQEEVALLELKIKKAQYEAQLAEAKARKEAAETQIEDSKLQAEERRLNMQDLRQRIGDRSLKDIQRQEDRASQGRTFAQQAATDSAKQSVCTHKKGGIVSQRNLQVLNTGGNSQQYSVIKHQMINGDMWVRCLRCGKTWSNPVEGNFFFEQVNGRFTKKRLPAKGPQAGVFNQEAFEKARNEWLLACNFETQNTPSASVQCRFTKWDDTANGGLGAWVDATEDYRKRISDTTLR